MRRARTLVLVFLLFLKLCSPSMEPRIVKGRDASIENWPFIAYVTSSTPLPDGKLLTCCGGSLLNSQTVLTAAHCLDDLTKKKLQFVNLDIFMGHSNIYKATVTRRVIDYTTFPKYDKSEFKFDVVVMFLAEPVKFSDTVKKTVLKTTSLLYPEEKDLLVAGWGYWSDPFNKTHAMSETLQYLQHEYIPNADCAQLLTQEIYHGTMCAKSLRPRAYAYHGDSGGPLVTKNDLFQIGIVSYRGVTSNRSITIFTHVPSYVDWIEQTQLDLYEKFCKPPTTTIRSSTSAYNFKANLTVSFRNVIQDIIAMYESKIAYCVYRNSVRDRDLK